MVPSNHPLRQLTKSNEDEDKKKNEHVKQNTQMEKKPKQLKQNSETHRSKWEKE